MRILFINPIGTDAFDADTARVLDQMRRDDTEVDVTSLSEDRTQAPGVSRL